MSSSLTWSLCTPYSETYGYDSFHSLYKNIRYRIRNYSTYKVTAADVANLPGISFNAYGTVALWRVILEFNGLNDPINDIQIGMTLNIPDKSAVASLLSKPLDGGSSASTTITI